MAQEGQDWAMFQNNRKILRYTCTNEETTTPLDLSTFASVQWAISRKNAEGTILKTAVLQKKTGGSGITFATSAAAGANNDIALVELVKADTANLEGEYHSELELVDGSGECVVLATGTGTFKRNIVNTL